MNQVAQYGQIKIDQFSVNFNLTEKMQETVGKWLQAKRKEKGLNQTELANRAFFKPRSTKYKMSGRRAL